MRYRPGDWIIYAVVGILILDVAAILLTMAGWI